MWIYHIGVEIALTQSEQINNAKEVYNFFAQYGYTLESICAILGNMDAESTINPGNKETASSFQR